MAQKKLYILITVIILAILGVGFYWFFWRNPQPQTFINADGTTTTQQGYNPFTRLFGTGGSSGNTTTSTTTRTTRPTATSTSELPKIPALRLLSEYPVGGYGASTTAKTTVIRWVDRGRGNIYEAQGDSLDIQTLSNTVVPKIFESQWNKTATSFVASIFDDSESPTNTLFAELKLRPVPKITSTKTATSTASSTPNPISTVSGQNLTPYDLKGKNLSDNIISYALSPKADKLFLAVKTDAGSAGYVASPNGSNAIKIFDSPLTQIVSEWPEDNTIAITTKAQAELSGYLYFVSPKTGIWKKILGPYPGLTTKVSHDAKYVIASISGKVGDLMTSVYSVASKKGVDAVFKTIADKCVWGNFNKNMVYCGVPNQRPQAIYPDDWFKGNATFVDKIWQTNATTGEIHLVSNIVDTADRTIDTTNLYLDQRDDFLFFTNKNDLSFWSLDLIQSN
jgi:hypothetical protein